MRKPSSIARFGALLLASCALAVGGARGSAPEERLGTLLGRVASADAVRGAGAALALARRHGLRVRADGRIAVVLEPRPGRGPASIGRTELRARGAEVDAASRSRLRVWVRPAQLARLSRHRDVQRVRAPLRALPQAGAGTIVSEAVGLVGADVLQQHGVTGAGVHVAVIDVGFRGRATAVAAGELPAPSSEVDFVGDGLDGDTNHGTAVAEQLVDVAPGVELHLLRISDSIDFENAADYARDQGIDIVNLSLAFPGGSYYDDTGPVSETVNDSRDVDGVFWSVSAGNFALRHWRGGWLDPDTDDVLDFVAGDESLEIAAGGPDACVQLNWDQYGQPNKTNLDLFVYDSDGALVDSSTGAHGGGADPVEEVCFVFDSADAPYAVEVERVSGSTASLDISVFSFLHSFVPALAETSVMDPASAHGAFTVGAVRWIHWGTDTIRPFSSQGLTTDGRSKPDGVAPDGTSSLTRAIASGTSFAAPVAAGIAALLLEQDPALSADLLAAELQLAALDAGLPGLDPVFGAGELQAALLPGFDSDGDGSPNLVDNCPHTPNDQLDTGGLGGPGADGIGDACQCGDAAGGGSVLASDADALRAYLAGLAGLAVPALCNVRGPADGGVADCDAVDLVVLLRALDTRGPGIAQDCAPALP